jgi:hypothetical protein
MRTATVPSLAIMITVGRMIADRVGTGPQGTRILFLEFLEFQLIHQNSISFSDHSRSAVFQPHFCRVTA